MLGPVPRPFATPARRRAAAWAAVWAVALVVAAASVLTARWFVWPPTWAPAPSAEARPDAIVMYGGAGDRFDLARTLAARDLAPVLVVSDPREPGQRWTAYEVFCSGPHGYEAICFDPVPQTTRGESRFVADLARSRGWEHVVLVTDVHQATRAETLLRRCWDGRVELVTVRSDRAVPLRIAYEWAAMARAHLLRRSC
jgi:uncharacterized SAM-binding protein YcdF (DUF218 family)